MIGFHVNICSKTLQFLEKNIVANGTDSRNMNSNYNNDNNSAIDNKKPPSNFPV